jgi:GWxTD domain-containing protein
MKYRMFTPLLPSSASLIATVGAILLFFGQPSAALHAQSAGTPATLNFAYSINSFAYSDSASLLELTYQYSERGLVYTDSEQGRVGQLKLKLDLFDSNATAVLQTDWITMNREPADEVEDRALLGQKLFAVPPGHYHARIGYTDLAAPMHADSADFDLHVRDFRSSKLQLSDVQLVSELTTSDDHDNPFYKNGYVVYPNPTGVIGPPFMVLGTYMEVYNGDQIPTSEYHLTYALADTNRRIFYEEDQKRTRPPADAVVEVNNIVLEQLKSGSYYLVIKAYNGPKNLASDSVMVIKPFSLYNPTRDSVLAAVASSGANAAGTLVDPMYAGLKEPELDEEFEKIWCITSEAEREQFERLEGTEAKARFLTYFWQRNDPDPSTPENDVRDRYYERVEEARAKYASPMSRRGWDSPRGRVLLQYGTPDQIDRHPHDFNRRPFEIWYYSATRYTFVFVDRSQTGTYRLVHSTAPREISLENWEEVHAMIDEQMGN